MSIPKIIHYCWFGGNPLPKEARRFIDTWKHYLPDYVIKEWNEHNFDVNSCLYAKEAYEAKKWAFVSDYVRFKVLYDQGGIYLDTDVEVIKSFDDLITLGSFMGKEASSFMLDKSEKVFKVNPGLVIGTSPHNELYKEMIGTYEMDHFINPDGTLKLYTVVDRMTDLLKKYGYIGDDNIEVIKDIYLYPPEYFCPMNPDDGVMNITENTFSIHHYAETWHSDTEKKAVKISRKFTGKGSVIYAIGRIITLPIRIRAKIENNGLKNTMGFAMSKLKKKQY